MSWFNKCVGVDFAVAEISDYSDRLENSISAAEEQYKNAIELSGKIREALVDVIEVGKNNLKVCESELDWRRRQDEAARQKIAVIERNVEALRATIRSIDERIAEIETQYKAACAQADRIRNAEVANEAEARQRSAAHEQAQKYVNACSAEKARLSAQRGGLYNLAQEAEADISKLRGICAELDQIDSHLRLERDKISSAIDTAESLKDELVGCERALKESFSKNIENGLYLRRHSVSSALAHANSALALMGSLNDRYYSDYDRVTVTNVGDLRVNAREMADMVDDCAAAIERLYDDCGSYGSLIDDRIMEATLNVLDRLSQQQDSLFRYVNEKASRLDDFCECLDEYCKTAIK